MNRRRHINSFLAIVGIVALLLGSFFIWLRLATAPVDPKEASATVFVIPPGQALDVIGHRLKEAGLIRSSIAFKLVVLKNGLARKIQAGDFRLKSSMSTTTVAEELTHGTLDIWVTLLEGWRREEMAVELAQEFANRELEFDIAEFINASKGQEGYLFPDTYLIPRTASGSAIVELLRDTFDKKVDLTLNQSGLTSTQTVILASIIEREVRTDKDRPLVAGILQKRLEAGWPLQADATIQYAVGSRSCEATDTTCKWWEPNLTRDHITEASPYNTYANVGLPPTPIANPGLGSIKAALNPQNSSYWFYISDLQGNIRYAETIEEHNQNIANYLGK